MGELVIIESAPAPAPPAPSWPPPCRDARRPARGDGCLQGVRNARPQRHARVQRGHRVLKDHLHPPAHPPHLRARQRRQAGPSNVTWPEVGSTRRRMARPVVDLPLPDSPASPNTSPRWMSKVTSSTARTQSCRPASIVSRKPCCTREPLDQVVHLHQRRPRGRGRGAHGCTSRAPGSAWSQRQRRRPAPSPAAMGGCRSAQMASARGQRRVEAAPRGRVGEVGELAGHLELLRVVQADVGHRAQQPAGVGSAGDCRTRRTPSPPRPCARRTSPRCGRPARPPGRCCG